MTNAPLRTPRLPLIDMARGCALIAMAVYHFSWDLQFFHFLDINVVSSPGGRASSTAIAGSFLCLVGISLVLAHGDGIRWRGFLRRLGLLMLAAGAVTLATRIAVPEGTIYFGILHSIAVSSLIGLVFLRLPWPVTAVAALGCLVAPHVLASARFNGFGWLWLGLRTVPLRSNDYEPLLPWFGFVLAGIALVRAVPAVKWPRDGNGNRPGRWLAFLGRHSLAFYLLHQPVLFGATWLAAQMLPPSEAAATAAFRQQCTAVCRQAGTSQTDCSNYCTCVMESARIEGIWPAVLHGKLDGDSRRKLDGVIGLCSR